MAREPASSKRYARAALMRRLPEVEAPGELWRPVSSYEGLYEVSDHGRVRSVPRDVDLQHRYGGDVSHHRKSVDLIPTPDRNGRLQVSLSREGATSYFGVASLVLAAFGKPVPRGWWVTYADGDKGNCALANLSSRPRGSTRARPA